MQLIHQSMGEPFVQDRAALRQRAWTAFLSAVAVLQHRLDAVSLQPGAVCEEERAFDVVWQAAVEKAHAVPEAQRTDAASLRSRSVATGYCAALDAVAMGLLFMRSQLWPAAERGAVQTFVLAALDAVPATAELSFQSVSELQLVSHFERCVVRGKRLCLDEAFRAAMIAKWTSPAVVSVLRARGSLDGGVASVQRGLKECEALKRADVAARGYRSCGLPACGKREVTVRHFKLCTGCDAVANCCDEHHDAHWREGHRRECRHLRAAGAQPPSTADGA